MLHIATHNLGKLAEFRALIPSGRWPLEGLSHFSPKIDWEEDATSFCENARIKARAVHRVTRGAVLADDSGLVVPALGGVPGVHSKRYAGPEGNDRANNEKLMRAIATIAEDQRHGAFMCSLIFIEASGREHHFSGSVSGQILSQPRGTEGFGYDPLFLVDGTSKTMAELSLDEKNRHSHRARAVQNWLAQFG